MLMATASNEQQRDCLNSTAAHHKEKFMNPNIARKRRQKARQTHDGGQGRQHHKTNVGEPERWASMFAGGFLAACGLMRGSLSGLALAAMGGALAYRGYTGHCQLYEALGHNSADRHGEIAVHQAD
jgi:hypothetical protein